MEEYFSLPSESDFEDFLNENKDWYYNTCFEKVHDNFYGEALDEVDIVVFLFQDSPGTEYAVSIKKEDYELNLSYCLAYFEEIEDYEKCAKVNELIENVRAYNELNNIEDVRED